ncbi:hypothetical protein PQR64_31755 [Paraburkholderia phytofirmans]|uniref:hypothetical protein n=1 Tax=Paraburkholderia phytofirmans TaxID=261302 RepID=UPI0038BB17F0
MTTLFALITEAVTHSIVTSHIWTGTVKIQTWNVVQRFKGNAIRLNFREHPLPMYGRLGQQIENDVVNLPTVSGTTAGVMSGPKAVDRFWASSVICAMQRIGMQIVFGKSKRRADVT